MLQISIIILFQFSLDISYYALFYAYSLLYLCFYPSPFTSKLLNTFSYIHSKKACEYEIDFTCISIRIHIRTRANSNRLLMLTSLPVFFMFGHLDDSSLLLTRWSHLALLWLRGFHCVRNLIKCIYNCIYLL